MCTYSVNVYVVLKYCDLVMMHTHTYTLELETKGILLPLPQ